MIVKKEIYIEPYKEYRTFHIYLPDHRPDTKKYPVLYMFDGHNLFFDEDATYGKSWGLKRYLDDNNADLIVVGMECNHKSNYRLCEYSPYSFSDKYLGAVNASGKILFDWMVNELKPFIDAQYPTLSNQANTYLGGSSMGGLMAIYGGAIHSECFSKSICISPFHSLILKELLNDIQNISKLKQSCFYISWGEEESNSKEKLAVDTENNLKIIRLLSEKGATVYPHCIKEGEHSEACWEKEIPIFIKELKIID